MITKYRLHSYALLCVVCGLTLGLSSCDKEPLIPRPSSPTETPSTPTLPKEENEGDNTNNPAPNPPNGENEGDSTNDPTPNPPNGENEGDSTNDPTPNPPNGENEGDSTNDPTPNPPNGENEGDSTNDPAPNPPNGENQGDNTNNSAPNPPNGENQGDSTNDPTPNPPSGATDQPWHAKARAGQTWWMRGVNTNIPPSSSWRYAFGEVRALEWQAGMGWYDLNKFDAHRGGTDSDLCWAAVCANVIQWWLDQNKSYMTRYPHSVPSGFSKAWQREKEEGEGFYHSEIFELYKKHFTNRGGDLKASIEWFFNGLYAHRPLAGAGFFREVFGKDFKAVTQIGTSARTFSDDVAEALSRGEGLSCSLEYPNGYLHALSIWGADFDSSGTLTHIYLTDSNDRTLVVDNRNNQRTTKAGLLRRAIKLDTSTGRVYQEGGTAGIFNFRIIHLYKLPLYQDKWEAYYAGQG